MDIFLIIGLFIFIIWRKKTRSFWCLLIDALYLCFAIFLTLSFHSYLYDFVRLFIPYPGHLPEYHYVYYPSILVPYLDIAYYRFVSCSIVLVLLTVLGYFIKALIYRSRPPKGRKGILTLLILILVAASKTIIITFFALAFLSFIGYPSVQNLIGNWSVADIILKQAPFLSETFFSLWFANIAVPF